MERPEFAFTGPRDEDPRFTSPEAIVDTFMLRVQAEVYVYT
jgi:hypothetical protein